MPRTGGVRSRFSSGTLLASVRTVVNDMERTVEEKNQGEGNRDADRRYRKGVQETVRETTEEGRAEQARNMTPEEQEEALRAEREGKARKRSTPQERKT